MARVPIGIELIKRNVATEANIKEALRYQKTHPDKKLGDILNILNLCDRKKLITAMGEILGEKVILISPEYVKINVTNYISIDTIKSVKAVPFEESNGKIKVCFADTSSKKTVDQIRLMLLHNGYSMEKYISFESNIEDVIKALEGKSDEDISSVSSRDITRLIDSIIKTAMDKNASDIHFEPMEKEIRVRYRIDGDLISAAKISKDSQDQVIGRLKAISNMYQEKTEDQDGRIDMYPQYNIRVSSQLNIFGEKFVLRLLKKDASIRNIYELGFPNDKDIIKKYFNKRNSITVVAAPTGEGKTTTLYSIMDSLNRPDVNIITIEDPVEIRIPGLNQVEIGPKNSFSSSLRTVLRQDPNIILVGEIRDLETAEIAMQAGQTGHYVLSTIHTIDSIEVITRLRKLGISDYDIGSTLSTSVSQRLIRRVCPHCAKERKFTKEEKDKINGFVEKYGIKFDFTDKVTYIPVGCKKCNMTGYVGRIAAIEILDMTENIRELITNGASTYEIRRAATEEGFLPFTVDALKKVVDGVTTLEEVDKKLVLFND
nr:type II/IV secretion system protein [Clostridia bacterium]